MSNASDNEQKIKKKIKHISSLLKKYSIEYYQKDNPSVSDFEYDNLLRELHNLELKFPHLKPADSPTSVVGGMASSSFSKVEHTVFMGSLQDAFDSSELFSFEKRIKEKIAICEFVVEPKIDGLSVSLEYINGSFVRGSTRGDGYTGEDVSLNLLAVESIPKKIKTDLPFLEVRGEVFMPVDVFLDITQKQQQNNENIFKNPRNAAAGSLRQKDPSIVKKRNLDCFIFNLQQAREIEFSTHLQTLEFLNQIGFKTIKAHGPFSNIKSCIREISKLKNLKPSLSYEIDGAVVKLNSLKDRDVLGATSKNPRWAIAFKYPPETKNTILNDIIVSVGRSGALTPIAVFDPVLIAGSKVERASLHNQDYIDNLNIAIGDTICIRKAGEIIPEVVEVVSHNNLNKPFKLPLHCPVCGSVAIKNQSEATVRCENPSCSATRLKNLIHFASKHAMDIEGLGISNIKALVDNNLLKSASDIYILTKQDLLTLDKFKDKKSDNLIDSIKKSKQNDLSRLIYALGIKGVGTTTSKLLASRFDDIYEIMGACSEDLVCTNTIGDKVAENILNYFSLPQSKELIERLDGLGVNVKSLSKKSDIGKLSGKTFAITGKFEKATRSHIIKSIENRGGRVVSSISSKTNYLAAGKSSGSKLKKAKDLNVKILNESELFKLLD